MYFYKFPELSNMSFNRIKAILIHEAFMMRHSFEVVNDIIIYPLLQIVIFGFLTLYLFGLNGKIIGEHVLIGTILWQIVSITQYSVSVGCLWDVWSKNLTNIFISPISTSEYFTAYMISGTIKSLLMFFLASILSFQVFHFNILNLGIINLIIYFINLAIFAFGFGIIILGLIFRFGNRIQAFAWAMIGIAQPFMAVIYPVSVLPKPLQIISYFFSPTYIFEVARINVSDKTIQWVFIEKAFLINLVFVFLAVNFFNLMFRESKKKGQFARLEG